MTINISRPPSVIKIGYDGENHWRPQTFDCSPLTARHPEGILTLWVMPNGVATAFPVAVTRDGDSITWTPLDSELVQGFGKLQIHCQDGNDLGKSDIMDFMVCESIVDGGEHPSETPSWAARVVEATGHYPKIENGTWWVWDVQNGEWSDTGVSAGGDVSPEQLAEAIEAYFDAHPVEGEPGPSAYELAVQEGYTGTLEEWLASLHGRDGTNGKDGADGKDGMNGTDGVSPAVSVSAVTGGHAVTITDKDHPNGQTFNVMDGKDGKDGQDGQDGAPGPQGPQGDDYVLSNADKQEIAGMAKDLLQIDSTPTPGSTNPVSSGGTAAALQGKEDTTETVTMTAADTAVTLQENKFYVFPEMAALTITCPATGGPFAFRFTSGATATTLSLTGVIMPDDFEVSANTVYEINVYEGYGLAVSWEVAS